MKSESGEWWVGQAGSARTVDLLEYSYKWGEIDSSPAMLANAIRKLIEDDGWTPFDYRGEPKTFDNSFIFASLEHGVFSVSNGFHVMPYGDEFCAIGIGANEAMGAAYVANSVGLSDQATVQYAIEAACKFNTYCGGEIVVRKL